MERQILKHPNEIEAWFQDRSKAYAFDFETTGLNYLKMQPVGVSFCDGDKSCYVDLWENGDYEDIMNILSVVFQSGLFIAHNLKYDWKCCHKFVGTEPKDYFCTHIASFLLDENRTSHSLDSLSRDYFGTCKAGKWDEYTDWHSEAFYEYATVDSELCYKLYELFEPRLKDENLDYLFYNVEMPFVPVAAELEMNGVLVDQDELAALQSRVEKRILDTEDQMVALVGKQTDIQTGLFGQEYRRVPINFNSTYQLVECFQKLGLQLKEKTDKGAWSIGKETLDRLKGNKFVDLLTKYRQLGKLYTSYILPVWGMIDEDGRIRPSVGIVKTGRTSMSHPNLQQLPKVKDKSINYRSIFSTDGLLVGADYSGQELRILGEVTQDECIIEAFKKSWDLHLLTARHIFDLDIDESALVSGSSAHSLATDKYSSERDKAKNGANFPIVYGTSPGGIARRQGVSKHEAQSWVDGFFQAYPRVKECMDKIPNELWENGYVTTLMGRKRRFPGYQTLPQFGRMKQPSKDRCIRQAFNAKIQGFAADQAKIAGRRLYDAFKANPQWGAKLVMLVHDEYVTDCKEEYAEEVRDCKIECMENAVSLSIPFKVDCKIGKRYAEIK